MSVDTSFAEYCQEQLSCAGDVTLKKMFGEYGFYINRIFAGLICDNQLFLKDLSHPTTQQPYPGAKNFRLVSIEVLEDCEALQKMVQNSMQTYG